MDQLMDARGLADYLRVPVATVYAWNTKGTGPRRHRVGKYVRYRRADVDAWLDSHSPDGRPAA